MSYQSAVNKNVQERGCLDSFESIPLLARHIARLQEELSEAAVLFMRREDHSVPFDLNHPVIEKIAKNNLDGGDWKYYQLPMGFYWEMLKAELADIQVVLLSMAELVDAMTPFDILEAALAKSAGDVSRGVR